jgi:hypothetical protein
VPRTDTVGAPLVPTTRTTQGGTGVMGGTGPPATPRQ